MPAARKPRKAPPSPLFEGDDGEVEIPEVRRDRTPKMEKLQAAIEGVYIMGGGALTTLPAQVGGARTKQIGRGLATQASEIADAWIDLAEDDKKVLKFLENLTSFSGWGKVVGLHLLVIGGGLPTIAAVMPQPQQQSQQQPPGNNTAQMMEMADLIRQMATEGRQQQEQQAQPPPQQPRPQQPQQPARGAVRMRAGMPSPADLGVVQGDVPLDFPTSGPENVGG